MATYDPILNPESTQKLMVPPDVQKRMIEVYQDGETLEQVGARFFYHYNTVRRVLFLNNVPRRAAGFNKFGWSGKRRDDKVMNEAVELYLDGYTVPEICQMVGRARLTIFRYLDAVGVDRRNCSQYQRMGFLRSRRTRVILQIVEDAGEPLTSQRINDLLPDDLKVSGAANVVRKLGDYGLLEDLGRKDHTLAKYWKRTGKSLRQAMAEVAPSPHLVEDNIPKLPSRPLVFYIGALIEREQRRRIMAGDTKVPGMRDGVQPVEGVCKELGVDPRTWTRWRRGASTTVQWEQIDNILTRGEALWFDLFNEETVRKPKFLIEVVGYRNRKNGRGKITLGREIKRTFYIGDDGTDYDELNRIRELFEPSTRQLVAA
jgi:hypothetical protein